MPPECLRACILKEPSKPARKARRAAFLPCYFRCPEKLQSGSCFSVVLFWATAPTPTPWHLLCTEKQIIHTQAEPQESSLPGHEATNTTMAQERGRENERKQTTAWYQTSLGHFRRCPPLTCTINSYSCVTYGLQTTFPDENNGG